VNVTAAENSERISAHEAPGSLGGFEFLDNLPIRELSASCAERALRMLCAPYIKGGQMPVVMGNAFGGVIFHEACGHPLETEAVRRQASPFCGKLGEQVAQPIFTAIDDGTISGVWGSLAVDDEGTPTQKTILIENGILKNFLSDIVGAKELNLPLTGSARRESYKYAPVSRMRNTFIATGNSTLQDMLATVDNGLYAAKMAGGSVNPATGEFNFAVGEGYEIKNGTNKIFAYSFLEADFNEKDTLWHIWYYEDEEMKKTECQLQNSACFSSISADSLRKGKWSVDIRQGDFLLNVKQFGVE
jgi:TldD protein